MTGKGSWVVPLTFWEGRLKPRVIETEGNNRGTQGNRQSPDTIWFEISKHGWKWSCSARKTEQRGAWAERSRKEWMG